MDDTAPSNIQMNRLSYMLYVVRIRPDLATRSWSTFPYVGPEVPRQSWEQEEV